eukprot:TRINITY_DN862_c0_g1_i6.p10 TRINITY_DN862_c0_g1~~TRINITY_DN862_c0_g1_i6.p10  ORF type:complete len:146 (-),score=32.15 TRINITY_DN862_c0_g1_i6:363-800(-)
MKFFTTSQELLQNLLQIPEVPLGSKKLVTDLLAEHKKGVKAKLENLILESNWVFSALQQHESEVHNKVNELCEKFYCMLFQEVAQQETDKKKMAEMEQRLKEIKDAEGKKEEECQIRYKFYQSNKAKVTKDGETHKTAGKRESQG